ncbi:mucin-binding protein [Lactobacillus agrestimuris]|uniref:mucin-binding protein n=1 Tax=Lactobacillus agrestimuris TaxID=2941328 RepID=UPI00204410CD|nr:LPXTG cell wall anchor domain-containing protein [Lactobacillus agrestimuris]
MKRLSRKNTLEREKSTGQVRQHFSFRKLNSGLLVSAAIGAFLIFDNNTVHAATGLDEGSNDAVSAEENQNSESEKIQQKEVPLSGNNSQSKNDDIQNNKNESKKSVEDSAEQNQQVTSNVVKSSDLGKADNQVKNVNGDTVQSKETEDSAETNEVRVADLISGTTKEGKSLTNLKASLAQKSTSSLPTPTVSDDMYVSTSDGRAEMIINNNKVGNVEGKNNITLQLDTNGAGKYVITIPDGIYDIKTDPLDPNYGTKTVSLDGRTFTYDITYDGLVKIPITLTTKTNYAGEPTPLADIGETQKKITWSVDGVEQTPLTFTQTIKPEWNPQSPVRTNPDPTNVKGVPVNTNVTYTFKVNETPGVNSDGYASNIVNSAVNYGTTITIPVPDGFILDEAATKSLNGFTEQYKTTITQPNGKGTDIIIEVPKGAGKQYWNQENIPGYQLAGRYDIPQPEKDLIVSADKPITIVQKLGDGANAQTMEATVPSFTDTIIGKETSIPLGDFSPTIAEAYGGNNNILPVTKNDIVVNYFGFTNSTIFSYKDDMKIKVDFPDGLTVNKISTPHTSDNLPGTTSYAYTFTLTDGTTLSGTVAAGESVSVPEGGNIQSAVFTPNEVAIGAQTSALPANDLRSQNTSVNAFIAYGHANEKYQNGDAIPNGAQLETTVSISSTATGDKTWIAKQRQQVVLPENLTSYLNAFAWQGNTQSSQQNSGYISVTYGVNNTTTTLNIYEPIFYYVIPATTNVTSPLSLQVPNVNGDSTATPKVTSFLADDGRTVVKIDYTGTKYYFNAGMNANTEVALNNNADATNGSSPWDIYIVSSTTKLANTEYSDSTKNNFSTNSATNPFDTSWVQGNVNNLYHLGGGTWTIQQIAGITTAPMIKGNQNSDYTNQGTSNDKGSPKIDISVSVPNGLTSSVTNGNAYISVPQTSLGSGFDFELSGPATFEKYPGDVQAPYTVTYSDETFDLYSGSEPNADAFKTEDQVTDWSKIKTIKVSIPNLAPNATLGRIIIPGTDPTIAEDAQKNGYVQTSLYIPGFATYTNKGTKLPSISINGTAKITSRYSYVDQDGTTKTIDIPDLTYNLNDNQATMPTETQVLSNLTAADKALIPEGYVIGSVQLIGPTEKSWQTDAPMGTPEFGQQVKYYYNNAIVQYNLVKRYSAETSTKDVTRIINYVDKTTNTAMPTDLVKGQTQTVTLTQVAVKNDAGEIIGYNTTGTWNNGVYTPSTDANGQIKVDVTDAANSWMNVSNAKWAAVTNPDLTVDGYKGPFDSDGTAYPTVAGVAVNGTTTDSNITVYYTENTIDVPPTAPKNPGDPITGTNKDYPNGVSEDDLNKTITRTINVIDASGQSVGQEVQTVKYTRTATVNVVTGEVVKYTDWTAENSNWAAYAPTLKNGEGIQAILDANGQAYSNVTKDGDTLTGVGSYTVPTTDTKDNDETVNIYLNKVITLNGTRTITYKTYDHNNQLTDTTVDDSQKVTLSGSQTFDPVTNKVVYSFDQTSATYPSLKVPVKTGYYASTSDIAAKTVSINNSDPIHSILNDSVTVNYHSMGKLLQVDQDGTQIEGTIPVIYPNDPNDATKAGKVTVPAAPEGWVIVNIDDEKSFTPTDPGHDTKIYYEKLDKVSENEKQVTRTITYIDKDTGKAIPTSVVVPTNQKATQYQFEVRDTDGKLLGYNTQGTWDENGNYIPSTQKNRQIMVDTTDPAESWIVKPGTNFPESPNPDLKQYGYSGPFEADGTTPYPTINKVEVTGKTTNSEVKVYYTEDVITVPPTEPHQPGEPITGTKRNYPDGVSDSDLNKTITRTIKIVDADGNQVGDPIVQKVTYSRTAKVNVVTGHVDYEDWTSNKKNWDSYAPTLQTGEGIQTVTDGNGQPYSNLTKNGNVITGVGAQDITYSATDKDDQTVIIYLNKAVSFTGTRTITYSFYGKDGQKTSTENGEPQTVTVSGSQTFDPATNKVVYTFDNSSAIYPAVDAPVKTGYYASTSTISDDTVSINQTNPQNSDLNATANVNYYPMGEVIQVDRDGNQIPGTTPVTYPNNPDDSTKAGEVKVPKAPEGWVIVTPSDGDPFTPTDPGKDTTVVYERLNEVTENTKDVTRTINYVDKDANAPIPTNLAPTVTQIVTLTQFIVKDASGNVLGYNTSGTWEDGKYTPSTEDNGQIKVDTTDENQSWMNSTNAKWAAVTNPNLAIAGYSGPFEENGTTAYPTIAEEDVTGITENSTLTVYYTEDTVEVPPTEPHKPGEPIGNTHKQYPKGVEENDLNKTITRTINVYDANGNVVGDPVLQTVKYTRTATVNVVTGDVKYSDWTAENGKGNWDEYAPTLQTGEGIQSILENGQAYDHVTEDGDKLTGVDKFNVPAPDANTGDTIKDETVNIYLNKEVTFTGTRTITYITHEKDSQTSSTETKQNVTVSGSQSYDPTTDKVVYTFEDPSATYSKVDTPVKAGYYASASQVGEETKTISETSPQDSDLNATATVDYYPMGEVIQVDGDGNPIPGTTPMPYPNDPDNPTKAGKVTVPPAPEGWVIVTPSDGDPFIPTDPGKDKKIVYEKLDQVTENTKEVTRTINYVDKTTGEAMPTNLAPTVTQTVTLTQSIVKDASGKIIGYNTSGTWEDGKYTPSKEDNGQIKVDTTDEAKSWMNGSNKNFDEVTNPNLTVDGYSGPFEENGNNYPTVVEMTVDGETPDKTLITIYYTENTVTVPPDKPIVPGDDGKIPNIPGTKIPYPNGVSDSDLNKTITRTINVYDTDGKLVGTSVVQEVKYSRIATVNVVTGKVTYTDWIAENDKDNWDEYAPQLQTGEGIQTITDASGKTYTNVTTNGDNKLTGVGAQDISNTATAKDNDETVNIYLNKEVTFTGTRTITYNTYDHDNKLIDSKDSLQHVSITGIQTYDPAKKQVVYTFDIPSATYSTEKVPVKDGYYASANEVASKTVTIDSSDPVHSNLNDRATVNYYPMGQLIQVDGDGNQIPGTTSVTYPNDPSDPTKAGKVTVPHTPEGWVIVTPSDGNPITPANPGLNTKIYYEKLDDAVPAYRTINRTITYVDLNTGMAMPSDVISPVIQRVTLTQYAVKDASGKVLGYNTSGTWEANGKYVPSKEANGQIKVDTTNENESWMNGSGANFEKVINKSLTVDGYSGPFEENGKTPYSEVSEEKVTGKTTNSEVFVYYTEDTVLVPPTDPKVPSDKIPNTNIPYPKGVSESDLNKSITRSINVYDASGRLVGTPVIQTVKYSRSATVNVVTGEVTYTDWSADKDSNGNWNSYTPQLQTGEGIQEVTDGKGQTYANVTRDGNKITGIGEQAIAFTATDKDDQTVNIYLNKEVSFTGTRTITYNTYDLDNKLIESKDSSQPISITGSQTYDPTKKQIVYTFINPNATYPSVKVPVKDGYYASANEVESKTVTIDSSDPVHSKLNDHVTVNYHPMGEVIQVDGDGNPIPGTTPVPYPNDPDNPTKAGKVTVPPAPEGWVIVTPSDGDPFIPTDPGVDKKVIYERIDDVVPNTKQITRTINYVDQTSGKSMPTNLVSTVIQKATLTQYVVKDASGKVLGYNTSGTWIDGKYTPSKETNGQIKVDTTNEADSWMNGSAEKFGEVTNPNLSVDGYDGPFTKKGSDYQTIDEEAVTGTTESSTVTVYYTEATVEVPPTSPQTPGNPIEGTNKDYPDGVKDSDLNKTITRTINVYDANGNVIGKSVVQTVKYSRSATVNVVTGEVTYTDWAADKDSNGNWNSYAPQLQTGEGIQEVTDDKGQTYVNVTRDGNKITGIGEQAIAFTATDKDDQTVNIYLNKVISFTGTRTITYITHEKDGQTSSTETKQNVTVSGIQSYDPATGKVVYTFENPSATYGVVNVPVKDGYYASAGQVDKDTVEINETNPQDSDLNAQATVDYYPMGNVIQVDGDGNPIPGTTPTPYPNDPTDPTKPGKVPVPPTPKGWKIVTSVDGGSIIPDKPGEDTPIKYEPIIDETTESKEVTRKIVVTTPDGKTKTITQTATVTRTVTTNEVTGDTEYGEWSKADFPDFVPDKIDGYTTLIDGKEGELVAAVPVTFKDGMPEDGVTVYVTYREIPVIPPTNPTEPSRPDKPTEPNKPGEPDKPTEPNKPGKPDKPIKPTKPGKPNVEKPSKDHNFTTGPRGGDLTTSPRGGDNLSQAGNGSQPKAVSGNSKQELPQTGSKDNSALSAILGLGSLLGALISFSWSSKKR